MKQVSYRKLAVNALRRIPANESARIVSKVEQYATDPSSLANNVKKLHGRKGWRLRVGDWRVIFDENNIVIDVIDIGPRGGIYDRGMT